MKEAGIYHVLAFPGCTLQCSGHLALGFTNLLPLRRRMRNGLALLCLWYPVLLSGGSHAVLRAAVMYSVLLVGRIISRKADGLNSLGLAVLLLILADPFAVLSYGFLLSVLATLGILLYERPLSQLLEKHLPVARGKLNTGLIHLLILRCWPPSV